MDTLKKILLTVIIPHRNIPDLLNRCLDSIPSRSDLQIIVVDDCSDEGMLPEKEVSRIQSKGIELYHTESAKGGGAARNLGLSHAKGEWITFIDADDYVTPKFNDIVDDLKTVADDVDIVYCAANSVDSDYYTTSDRADTLNGYICGHQKQTPEAEMRLRFTFGEPWCKIVRRKLIEDNKIRFSETSIHNDTKYSYLVGYHAGKISSTPNALCTITTRGGSVSRTLSESKKIERIGVFAEAHRFFREHGIPQKYVINFLWPQMARSLFENKTTYGKGREILRDNGFSSSEIVLNTVKHIVRNKLVALAKRMNLKR